MTSQQLTSQARRILAVVGPTGIGKSELAVSLAERINGEIVNLDSVQVYRELEIGAAKPAPELLKRVPHHLFDIVSVGEPFDVARYRELADAAVADIHARGAVPVLCGGTTMYLTALLHGLSNVPGANLKARRDSIRPDKLSDDDRAALYAELQQGDPVRAAQLHPNDSQRIRRAIDLLRAGIIPSQVAAQHEFKDALFDALIFLCQAPREHLYAKINQRARLMIERGLIDETRVVAAQFPGVRALDSLGYRQVLEWDGADRSELVEQIATATRQFAKRQLTFWRNEPSKRGWIVRDAMQHSGGQQSAGSSPTGVTSARTSLEIAQGEALRWLSSSEQGRIVQPIVMS